jgi:hypothetical protein
LGALGILLPTIGLIAGRKTILNNYSGNWNLAAYIFIVCVTCAFLAMAFTAIPAMQGITTETWIWKIANDMSSYMSLAGYIALWGFVGVGGVGLIITIIATAKGLRI